MTEPLQTQLRARAAEHARDWQSSAGPDAGVAEVHAQVRRKRRERGLLAGAGSVVGVFGLGVAIYAIAGGAGHVGPAAPASVSSPMEFEVPEGVSPFTMFAAAPPGSVILTATEPFDAESIGGGIGSVFLVDPERGSATRLPIADLYESIDGDVNTPFGADGWPTISLVAVHPDKTLAVFYVSDPLAFRVPEIVLYDWTADAETAYACDEEIDVLDASQWCGQSAPSAAIADPVTGEHTTVVDFDECQGAAERAGEVLAASCVSSAHGRFLVTVDPATGEVVSEVELGAAASEAPWVVGGRAFANLTTVEGDPVLQDSTGAAVEVGGGWVGGLAAEDDWILVETSSDVWGPQSTYGRVLGLWFPQTDEFMPIDGTELGIDTQVAVVDVLSEPGEN